MKMKKRMVFVNLIIFWWIITSASFVTQSRARTRVKRKRSRRDDLFEKSCTDTNADHFSTIPGESESFRMESRTHLADINPPAHYCRVCHRLSTSRSCVEVEEEKCRRKCRKQEWWTCSSSASESESECGGGGCRGGRDLDPRAGAGS